MNLENQNKKEVKKIEDRMNEVEIEIEN